MWQQRLGFLTYFPLRVFFYWLIVFLQSFSFFSFYFLLFFVCFFVLHFFFFVFKSQHFVFVFVFLCVCFVVALFLNIFHQKQKKGTGVSRWHSSHIVLLAMPVTVHCPHKLVTRHLFWFFVFLLFFFFFYTLVTMHLKPNNDKINTKQNTHTIQQNIRQLKKKKKKKHKT